MTRDGARGFGIYVHWPFCAQKCPYCDFNSHVRFDAPDEARFVAAYKIELTSIAQMMSSGGGHRQRTVSSIFFGGGTPSLMKPQSVAAILDHIATLWPVDANAEITLEANPGSVEAARFAGYRAAGVNRVSVGVQSLIEDDLKRLGRIHTVDEARAAITIASRTFERFSFDLIYARPGQTTQQWGAELDDALAIAGDHMSLYQLTIEPETPFATLHAAGKLVVPNPDAALALYQVTQTKTSAHGLPSYEISNHAIAGEESRHNLVYWRYGEYVGVGPGAHGRIIIDDEITATSTEKMPETWLDLVERNGQGLVLQEPVSASEAADEMLLMGLRLREGLDVERLAAVSGFVPGEDIIGELEAHGVLERCENGRRLRARGQGRFILNELVVQLSAGFVTVEDVAPAINS